MNGGKKPLVAGNNKRSIIGRYGKKLFSWWTQEILRERIKNAFMEIKDNPYVIRKAVLAVRHRANRCVERNGGHVEGY